LFGQNDLRRIEADDFLYAIQQDGNGGEYAVVRSYRGELPEVSIPERVEGIPVREIGTVAFLVWETKGRYRRNTTLRRVEIPDGVRKLAHSCFSQCRELTSVKMPDVLDELGSFAFLGCTELQDVSIPRSINRLGTSIFSGCRKLPPSIAMHKTVKPTVWSDEASRKDELRGLETTRALLCKQALEPYRYLEIIKGLEFETATLDRYQYEEIENVDAFGFECNIVSFSDDMVARNSDKSILQSCLMIMLSEAGRQPYGDDYRTWWQALSQEDRGNLARAFNEGNRLDSLQYLYPGELISELGDWVDALDISVEGTHRCQSFLSDIQEKTKAFERAPVLLVRCEGAPSFDDYNSYIGYTDDKVLVLHAYFFRD